MSDLQFRSTSRDQNRVSTDLGGSTAGLWLITAGIALSIIVLAVVFSSGPDTSAEPGVAPAALPAEVPAPAAADE